MSLGGADAQDRTDELVGATTQMHTVDREELVKQITAQVMDSLDTTEHTEQPKATDNADQVIAEYGDDVAETEFDMEFLLNSLEGSSHMQALDSLVHGTSQTGYAIMNIGSGNNFVWGPSVNNYIGRMLGVHGWIKSAKNQNHQFIATLPDVQDDGTPFPTGEERSYLIRGDATERKSVMLNCIDTLMGKLTGSLGYELNTEFWLYNSPHSYNKAKKQDELNQSCWFYTGRIGTTEFTEDEVEAVFAVVQPAKVVMVDGADGKPKARLVRQNQSSQAKIKAALVVAKKVAVALSLSEQPATSKRTSRPRRKQALGEGSLRKAA